MRRQVVEPVRGDAPTHRTRAGRGRSPRSPAAASAPMLRHQMRIVSGQPWTSSSGRPAAAGAARRARTRARRRRARRPAARRIGRDPGRATEPGRTPAGHYPAPPHDRPALRPARDRAPLAAGLGRGAHLGGRRTRAARLRRRRSRSPTCSRCCPTPRGEPHIGHLKIYSVGDAIAHFRRRNGCRVLHPMGYDAFGLPAENHAIKTGEHPRDVDRDVDRRVPAPVPRVGHLDRLVARVRHPRAALLPLDAVDLPEALRARPRLPQGGAGQVVPEGPDRARQRAGDRRALRALRHAVEVRQLEQWFFRITDYADRLLDDLDTIDWPEHVKTMQRNWIGRSEGAEVDLPLRGARASTTPSSPRAPTRSSARRSSCWRPSTPTSSGWPRAPSTRRRCASTSTSALTESTEERGDAEQARRPASPLGRTSINPVNGERDPDVRRRLRADGVRHRRDHGRARPRRARLRLRRDVRPADPPRDRGRRTRRASATTGLPYAGDGPLVNSGRLRRHAQPRGATSAIVAWLEPRGHAATPSVNYRLRDWLVSRQRYWGCPIPIVYCDDVRHRPGPRGPAAGRAARHRGLRAARASSPLAAAEDWVNTDVPDVRRPGAARDRHDGHLRRLLLVLPALLRRRTTTTRAWDRAVADALDAGRPVHRRRRARDPAPDVRALLLQGAGRHRACSDVQEPFANLFTQGMITRDGAKMSKSQGQLGQPAPIRRALRRRHRAHLHPASSGRPTRTPTGPTRASRACTASSRGSGASAREVAERDRRRRRPPDDPQGDDAARCCARRTGRSTRSPATWRGRFAFNTAIAAVMELVNEVSRLRDDGRARARVRFAPATAASLLFPFAPHAGAEVYELLTGERVWEEPWPAADPALLASRHLRARRARSTASCATASRRRPTPTARTLEALALARRRTCRPTSTASEVVKEIVVPGQARQPRRALSAAQIRRRRRHTRAGPLSPAPA